VVFSVDDDVCNVPQLVLPPPSVDLQPGRTAHDLIEHHSHPVYPAPLPQYDEGGRILKVSPRGKKSPQTRRGSSMHSTSRSPRSRRPLVDDGDDVNMDELRQRIVSQGRSVSPNKRSLLVPGSHPSPNSERILFRYDTPKIRSVSPVRRSPRRSDDFV
jgi:hypothetical protein